MGLRAYRVTKIETNPNPSFSIYNTCIVDAATRRYSSENGDDFMLEYDVDCVQEILDSHRTDDIRLPEERREGSSSYISYDDVTRILEQIVADCQEEGYVYYQVY